MDHVSPVAIAPASSTNFNLDETNIVSTHVLVPADRLEKLRELAKRTRVNQSEYLREAVDDLLKKYEQQLLTKP